MSLIDNNMELDDDSLLESTDNSSIYDDAISESGNPVKDSVNSDLNPFLLGEEYVPETEEVATDITITQTSIGSISLNTPYPFVNDGNSVLIDCSSNILPLYAMNTENPDDDALIATGFSEYTITVTPSYVKDSITGTYSFCADISDVSEQIAQVLIENRPSHSGIVTDGRVEGFVIGKVKMHSGQRRMGEPYMRGVIHFYDSSDVLLDTVYTDGVQLECDIIPDDPDNGVITKNDNTWFKLNFPDTVVPTGTTHVNVGLYVEMVEQGFMDGEVVDDLVYLDYMYITNLSIGKTLLSGLVPTIGAGDGTKIEFIDGTTLNYNAHDGTLDPLTASGDVTVVDDNGTNVIHFEYNNATLTIPITSGQEYWLQGKWKARFKPLNAFSSEERIEWDIILDEEYMENSLFIYIWNNKVDIFVNSNLIGSLNFTGLGTLNYGEYNDLTVIKTGYDYSVVLNGVNLGSVTDTANVDFTVAEISKFYGVYGTELMDLDYIEVGLASIPLKTMRLLMSAPSFSNQTSNLEVNITVDDINAIDMGFNSPNILYDTVIIGETCHLDVESIIPSVLLESSNIVYSNTAILGESSLNPSIKTGTVISSVMCELNISIESPNVYESIDTSITSLTPVIGLESNNPTITTEIGVIITPEPLSESLDALTPVISVGSGVLVVVTNSSSTIINWEDGSLEPWISRWGLNDINDEIGWGHNELTQVASLGEFRGLAELPISFTEGRWKFTFQRQTMNSNELELAFMVDGFNYDNMGWYGRNVVNLNSNGHISLTCGENTVADAYINYVGGKEVIEITRDSDGNFKVYYNDELVLTANDTTITSSNAIGIGTWSGDGYAVTYWDSIELSQEESHDILLNINESIIGTGISVTDFDSAYIELPSPMPSVIGTESLIILLPKAMECLLSMPNVNVLLPVVMDDNETVFVRTIIDFDEEYIKKPRWRG